MKPLEYKTKVSNIIYLIAILAFAQKAVCHEFESFANMSDVVHQIAFHCTGQINYNAFSILEQQYNELKETMDSDASEMKIIEKKIDNIISICKYGRRTESMNCEDLSYKGVTHDGIYNILVDGKRIPVYCEFKTNETWLVIQRRYDGFLDFYRDWKSYQRGFGYLNGEFWLGLDNLHIITNSMSYTLRIEFEDWQHNVAYAEYKLFAIGNPESYYTLNVTDFSGNAGNSLIYHNFCPFTTKDKDNDSRLSYNCAIAHHGAWWYRACHYSNLNGSYLRHSDSYVGVNWFHWKHSYYSMKKVVMKIRPTAVVY